MFSLYVQKSFKVVSFHRMLLFMLVLSYKQGFCSISASHFESGHHQTVNFQVGGAQIAKEETPLTTDMRFVWNSTFEDFKQ